MVELLTERLRLRPFERGDLEAFAAYRAAPEVAAYQSWDESFGPADAERFLASQQGLVFGEPGEFVQLAIVDRESGSLLGDCAVRVLDEQPRMAELGVTLAPASQGRGVAAEALRAVVDHLFGERELHRIFAQTDERNAAVHRLFERLGFRCEARFVEADWFKGQWTSVRVYALLRREWA